MTLIEQIREIATRWYNEEFAKLSIPTIVNALIVKAFEDAHLSVRSYEGAKWFQREMHSGKDHFAIRHAHGYIQKGCLNLQPAITDEDVAGWLKQHILSPEPSHT